MTDILGNGSTVNSGKLNAATVAGPTKTDAAASQAQLSSDINFFLKMLTTQLKNQDPSAPLDTNQFTQQIAQYSSVQQQVNTNLNLEKLLASNKLSSVSTAVSYIGKEIESKGDTGVVSGGQGAFSYLLPQAVETVNITISDATGRVVFTGNGDRQSGRNIVVWDGVNSATGVREPDGAYKIVVQAKDAAGKAITAETRSVGVVTGVESDGKGETLLSVGKTNVNFSDVLAVRAASRAVVSGS